MKDFMDGLHNWAETHKGLRMVAGFVIFGTILFFTSSLWVAFAVWILWKCLIS